MPLRCVFSTNPDQQFNDNRLDFICPCPDLTGFSRLRVMQARIPQTETDQWTNGWTLQIVDLDIQNMYESQQNREISSGLFACDQRDRSVRTILTMLLPDTSLYTALYYDNGSELNWIDFNQTSQRSLHFRLTGIYGDTDILMQETPFNETDTDPPKTLLNDSVVFELMFD